MGKRVGTVRFSNALGDRICKMLEGGMYVKQVAEELGIDPSTIRKWVRVHEDFSDQYKAAYSAGWHERIERALIRLEDSSRDQGRTASATVTRDTNHARMVFQAAALTCPKDYGAKVAVEHSGVTEKRVVVVEKFDGAKIARFTRS